MWTGQGVTTFRKFWARSAHFGQNGGWDESRKAQIHNGRFSPNMATKRISVSRRWILKDIFENFHFRGHLPPKSEIENRSNRHLTSSRLQVKGCTAEILFTPRCSPRAREFPRSVNFSVQRMVAELRGIKVAKFSDFGLFSPYKTPQNIPSSDQPTAQGLHHRMIMIFPCGSWRSKGVPSSTGVFLRLLVGELGTPELAQIFAYGKRLYPYTMQLHITSNVDHRCLKTRNSKDGCTFPLDIFAPIPKITPKPHFRDVSMQNLLYR